MKIKSSIFSLSICAMVIPALSQAKIVQETCNSNVAGMECQSRSNNNNQSVTSTDSSGSSGDSSPSNNGNIGMSEPASHVGRRGGSWRSSSLHLRRTQFNAASQGASMADRFDAMISKLEQEGKLGSADAANVKEKVGVLKDTIMSAVEDRKITDEERQSIKTAQKEVADMIKNLTQENTGAETPVAVANNAVESNNQTEVSTPTSVKKKIQMTFDSSDQGAVVGSAL